MLTSNKEKEDINKNTHTRKLVNKLKQEVTVTERETQHKHK